MSSPPYCKNFNRLKLLFTTVVVDKVVVRRHQLHSLEPITLQVVPSPKFTGFVFKIPLGGGSWTSDIEWPSISY